METQQPLAVRIAKPHRAAQRRTLQVVNPVGDQDCLAGQTHRDQVERAMASCCGIGCRCLSYRFSVPDTARSPKLSEVRVQEPTNLAPIGANCRVEKKQLAPDNLRAVL